ncbi:MAG TPA: hypothetical protein VIR60_09525 [Gammaproteobacteria bacterium]
MAAQGASVEEIAEAAVATWRNIDAALSPIIGQRGVAALYKRSLHLSRAHHPWLTTAAESTPQPDDFTALQTATAQQTTADAMAANDALLQNFTDLLANLIGASLTERLLRSVWDHPSSGHAVPETAP